MTSHAKMRWQAAAPCAVLLPCLIAAASALRAAELVDDSRAKKQRRAEMLEQMRDLARATTVRYQEDEGQLKLAESPVFRYDDQPRFFVDATLWVWTDGGRPAAFEKIEAAARGRPRWGYCFTSVSDRLLEAAWSDGRKYRSTAPGVDFRPLPDAPAVPAKRTARKLAARKLVRDFSARILLDEAANATEQMRLLPTPIFEYSDAESKTFLGAVFGLATSGTNPDALILLEPRESEGAAVWHYGAARMTTGGVTLKYRENVVWEVDFYPPRPTAFPTWTFFQTWRTETERVEAAK